MLLISLLKPILLLLLLAGINVGIYFLVKFQNWPWWAGLAIGLGVLGLILIIFFVKKWMFRRREDQFVKHIMEHEDNASATASRDTGLLSAMRSHFQRSIDALRSSHLRQKGDPLYVLPWYLSLGAPGAGKTEALRSSRLQSSVTDAQPVPDGSATQSCDWWFFEKAIVLDTAGRYTLPTAEGSDQQEWQELLMLFAKHRRKEPINGVIVTVSANQLMNLDADALADQGRSIRRRLDELMRTFGARFPVYVMVSKMDQVLGLTGLAERLPPQVLAQAMGHANASTEGSHEGLVAECFALVSGRLKDLRLELLRGEEKPDPGLLLFAEEFAGLQPMLAHFVDATFEANPYQEAPALRGIYFSSARQEGTTQSRALGPLAAFQEHQETLPGTTNGLFLRDFFDGILPADRNLFTPIKEFLRWRMVTRSLGFLAILAIMVFVCGLLSLSFFKNLGTINTFKEGFSRSPTMTGDLVKDVLIIKGFREKLTELEALNEGWWLPRLGLTHSEGMEEKLKREYCRLFQEGFLQRLDLTLMEKIGKFADDTPEEIVVAYVEHLGTRIGLLDSRLEDELPEDSQQLPQSTFSGLVAADPLMPEMTAKYLLPLYVIYLQWTANAETITAERTQLMNGLRQLAMTRRGRNLQWLVKWANVQPSLPPVTMGDFWGRDRIVEPDRLRVPPAFTTLGRAKIEKFIGQYETAVEDPTILQGPKIEFQPYYRREYVKAWKRFLEKFDSSQIRFVGETERREVTQQMAEPSNPYFAMIERMGKEMSFLADGDDAPPWARNAMDFQVVMAWAEREERAKKGGSGAIPSIPDMPAVGSVEDLAKIAKEGEQLIAYKTALTKVVPMTTSSNMAFRMASMFYTGGADQKSPMHAAHGAFTRLKAVLRKHHKDNKLFLRLAEGPLAFLTDYMIHEAAVELQNRWDGNVLAEIRHVPDSKRREAMFDKSSGVVWKFVKGPAVAFVTRGRASYRAASSLGHRFPLRKQFFDFLDKGSVQQQSLLPEYKVNIKTRPTNVNQGAIIEPHSTLLSLRCNEKTQNLKNLNYPIKRDFIWKPDNCGDVTLEIHFKDFTLTKKYEGPGGFQAFLREFRRGTRSFTPGDFPPASARRLAQMRVSNIGVGYTIRGAKALLDIKGPAGSLPVPKAIVSVSADSER